MSGPGKRAIDLNADLGEYADAAGRAMEREILCVVTSCNIACGGHTGDEESMRLTLEAARAAGVAAGAHPSYPDREGWGRRRIEIAPAALRAALEDQIRALSDIAGGLGVRLTHVKPHGALYNAAADDAALAALVAQAVAGAAPGLPLVGLPGSAVEDAAIEAGIGFFGEAFIDRRYTQTGRLVPRGEDGAVIGALEARIAQALSLAGEGRAEASDGAPVPIQADTLCLHGDSTDALETARAVRRALEAAGHEIRPLAHHGSPAGQVTI